MTLVELVVVVAIVGILAAAAMFMYGRQVKKARKTEVNQVFAEFVLRQEQYYVENGKYLSSGADEDDSYPSPTAKSPGAVSAPLPAGWTSLGLNIGKTELYCSYVAIAGQSDADAVGTSATNDFGFVAPDQDWYYVLAKCPFNKKVYMRRFDRDNIAENTL